MNVPVTETDEECDTKFRRNIGYTNYCFNREAEETAFQYTNFILDKYEKNPEKCRFPITLGLHKKYINRWKGCIFGYFTVASRTGRHIWIQSPFWNNNTKRFKLRIDSSGKEYILTKFGKIYAHDYLSIPIAHLEQSYKDMKELMRRQLGYVISRGHLEEYNYVRLPRHPGYIEITSVEELQDYYGGIAKTLDAY